MFWCDKCEIWEHEECLVAEIRKEYLKSTTTAIIQEIAIDAKDSEPVMAYITEVNQTAEQETEGVDQKDRSTKTAIAVKCLKCAYELK